MTLKPNLIIELIDPEQGIKVHTTLEELRDWMFAAPFIEADTHRCNCVVDTTPTSGGEITRTPPKRRRK